MQIANCLQISLKVEKEGLIDLWCAIGSKLSGSDLQVKMTKHFSVERGPRDPEKGKKNFVPYLFETQKGSPLFQKGPNVDKHN